MADRHQDNLSYAYQNSLHDSLETRKQGFSTNKRRRLANEAFDRYLFIVVLETGKATAKSDYLFLRRLVVGI